MIDVRRAPRVGILDEGVDKGRVREIDFAGAGVGATVTGDRATVTIPGGGGPGGASATTVEVDLGTPKWRGKFTIIDAAITAASKVLAWQAPGPYTGKGTLADEAEIQPVSVIAVVPAAGSAVVHWQTPPMVTMSLAHTVLGGQGEKRDNAVVGGQAQNYWDRFQGYQQIARRLGKVEGNVKFSYMVLG